MKQKFFRFTVAGSSSFPLDMLRSDTCWPTTADDVIRLAQMRGADCSAMLIRMTGITDPNLERWKSFGWRVIEVKS